MEAPLLLAELQALKILLRCAIARLPQRDEILEAALRAAEQLEGTALYESDVLLKLSEETARSIRESVRAIRGPGRPQSDETP